MIPQRVSIEGFLSYRNQVEFFFDNAPIWMLTGKNGTGKSTVFDAITFALYGDHRGGKKNVDELINRHCDHLAVEFDFMLGDDCYRVRRTVPRKGGSVYQATHLSGPSSPNRNRPGPQPVPGTDSKAGLTQWVQQQLGLNEDAFKLAVLLEQGKSDALLSAEARQRHALLSQIVDLSRYDALEKRARERQNEAKAIRDQSNLELSRLPRVSDAQIAAQQAFVASSKKQVEDAQTRLEQLQALRVHAEQWNTLHRQREDAQNSLEAMHILIADAEYIETAALRLDELQNVLPVLRRILQHYKTQVGHQCQATHYHQEALRFSAKIAEITPLHKDAQQNVTLLQQESDAAQNSRNIALQRLNELATPMHHLAEMTKLRQQVTQCDEQLAKFSPELEHQVNAAQKEVEELTQLKTLFPHAKRYVDIREQWRTTGKQVESNHHHQNEAARCAQAATIRLQTAQDTLTTAREQLVSLQGQKSIAHYALNDIRQQLVRFEQVGNEPSCPYCGQPLSPEHLSDERARLETKLTENERTAAIVTSAEHAAQRAVDDAAAQVNAQDAEYEAVLRSQREGATHYEMLIRERSRLQSEGEQVLRTMSEINITLLPLPNSATIDLCFAAPQPTLDNLAQIKERIQGYDTAQATRQTLQQSMAECQRHLASRQQWDRELQSLTLLYPEVRVKSIRKEFTATQKAYDDTNNNITRITPRLKQMQEGLLEHETALQRANTSHRAIAQEAVNAEHMAEAEQAHWQQAIDTLTSAWQEAARQVDDTQIATWQNELDSLQGADQRHDALRRARDQMEWGEKRLSEIEDALAVIPIDAQQDVAKLKQEEDAIRIAQRQSEEAYQRATSELHTLQQRSQRINELTTQLLAAQRRVSHYDVLVKYLGRDYLQRFLLQQAETTIVSLANYVLDNCSGGTLSMELRPNEGEGSISQKAFDLVVENRITQTPQNKMLPVWLLSGSQRFRVAISLALAIGQYASQNGQRIESVIIDEGFGSLDKQGLQDMEEALRGLDGTIKRIILVSHQEEFATAFPNRYQVWLEDGASQVKLADGSDAL